MDVTQFERDIIKKYRGPLWAKFVKALKTFNLVEENDRILVALSGGKDSLVMAKLFMELKKHPLVNFDCVFVLMNPGYAVKNLNRIEKLFQSLNIPYYIENYKVFPVVEKMAKDNPCFLCSKMRRGILYKIAEEHHCNKLALGHHYDDVIETTLLNVFYAGSFKTMLPKINSLNYEGIDLIRPLYFIREKAIINIMKAHGLENLKCGCVLSEGRNESKRDEVKQLIQELKKVHMDIDKNIFRAADNVNIDNILGYVKDGKKHRFDDKE